MSNAQFACLITPQALLLVLIIGTWIKRHFEDWSSKLRYDCTAHVHDLQLRLDTIRRGQDRLQSGLENLQRRQ